VRDLLEGASPFVSLDQARRSAFSPAMMLSFASPDRASFVSDTPRWPVDVGEDEEILSYSAATATRQSGNAKPKMSLLPNPTMNFDLRTLNLHLALRTAEVMACAEAMWEWVVEYQKKYKDERARAAAGAVMGDVDLRAIARMSRSDFDGILGKFESWVSNMFSHLTVNY
jgi:hypothetical protein